MRIRILITISILAIMLGFVTPTQAAGVYYFQMTQMTVNVYWNGDGTESIDYVINFKNDPSAGPIEFVDLGLPNNNYDVNSIYADVGGKKAIISQSDYQGSGSGVAIDLRPNAIQPGKSGQVHVFVGIIKRVIYEDTKDSNYASGDFAPFTVGSSLVYGVTDMSVTFHFPTGVQPDEPRWHSAPSGFPSEPQTGFDKDGRITYTWENINADASTVYLFGASFPKKYIPADTIVKQSIFEKVFVALGISTAMLVPCGFVSLCIVGIIGISVLSTYGSNRRKLKYLPPKISIAGHGIKRGLTAIEAAILMEEPIDKVMTMILFAIIKKNAAEVVKRDPLQIRALDPQPEGLYTYEKEFLAAFQVDTQKRRKELQDMMINLVKSVSEKMKGFSRRETVDYYRSIMTRAWAQVEAANTPEVKSQKFDEVMEWTMLDRNFNDRTRDIFRTQPVFVPIWWGRYDPVFRSGQSAPVQSPVGSGMPSVSMPHLPGADFAASIVNGVQNFSSKVVGNITDFTSGVTNKTNPVPVTTYSSRGSSGGRSGGGGGHSCACACACACAGCACACAGGGR